MLPHLAYFGATLAAAIRYAHLSVTQALPPASLAAGKAALVSLLIMCWQLSPPVLALARAAWAHKPRAEDPIMADKPAAAKKVQVRPSRGQRGEALNGH